MIRKALPTLIAFFLVGSFVGAVSAAGPKFLNGGNKHNLSSTNTGVTYQAAPGDPLGRDTQVCIFCHIPHNGNTDGPLWNRKASSATFARYSTQTLVIRRSGVPSSYDQPNGSSRLCLSCHDGVTAGADLNILGDVAVGGAIAFPAGKGRIDVNSISAFTDQKMKTGHHPVSFVYDAAVYQAISSAKAGQGYKLPSNPSVKLQKINNKNWMQCTTCHDPHQNQTAETTYPLSSRKIAPFWVLGTSGDATTDRDTVCTDCHTINRSFGIYSSPWPWP